MSGCLPVFDNDSCPRWAPAAFMSWLQEAQVLEPPPKKVLVGGSVVFVTAAGFWCYAKVCEKRKIREHRLTIHRKRVRAYIRDFEEQLKEAEDNRMALQQPARTDYPDTPEWERLQEQNFVLRHEASIIDWPSMAGVQLPTTTHAAAPAGGLQLQVARGDSQMQPSPGVPPTPGRPRQVSFANAAGQSAMSPSAPTPLGQGAGLEEGLPLHVSAAAPGPTPLVQTGTDVTVNRPALGCRREQKIVYVVNKDNFQKQKRLRILSELTEEQVLAMAKAAVGIDASEPVTVSTQPNVSHAPTGDEQSRPPKLAFDSVKDGAVFFISIEKNRSRRRQSMVSTGLREGGTFRYSFVDFKEVQGLLRKSVLWGDHSDPDDMHDIQRLHKMLAKNLLERMEAFAKNPDDDKYRLGGLDKIESDLIEDGRGASLVRRLNGRIEQQLWYRICNPVLGWLHCFGLLKNVSFGHTRRSVLLPFRAPPGTHGAEEYANPGDWTSTELLRFTEEQLRIRRRQNPQQLWALMRRTHLRPGTVFSKAAGWAVLLVSNFLQPFVTTLMTRFSREALDTDSPQQVRRLMLTLGWLLAATTLKESCSSLCKYILEQAVMETETSIRRAALETLARADQSFIDQRKPESGQGPLEELADNLESDLTELSHCLRHSQNWASQISQFAGVVYFLVCAWRRDESARSALAGAGAGVLFEQTWQLLKDVFAQWVNPDCEEEDDEADFTAGSKVRFRPDGTGRHDADAAQVELESGDYLENGEIGEVIRVVAQDEFPLVVRFPGGRESRLAESDLELCTEGAGVGLLPLGGPDDGMYGPAIFSEQERFEVYRIWGMEVAQLCHGLDQEERMAQHSQAVSFSVVPNSVDRWMESSKAIVSSATTTVVALVVLQAVGSQLPCGVSMATKAADIKQQLDTAVSICTRLPREVQCATQDVFKAAARTLNLLEYRWSIDCTEDGQREARSGRIGFSHVYLSYGQADSAVLQDLNLVVQAGEMVALVGTSGCGKTSLFRLLTRLYDPTSVPVADYHCLEIGKEGRYLARESPDSDWRNVVIVSADLQTGMCSLRFDEPGGAEWSSPVHRSDMRHPAGTVTIDDRPLSEYHVRYLRGGVVVTMLQDVTIFEGTIAFNIKYARPRARPEQVKDCIYVAGLDQWISRLPEGQMSRLGPGGIAASGGQRRRIGLARTLLAAVAPRGEQEAAKVLLLDEPTAGLDASAEAIIRSRLKHFAQRHQITIITVSHSLAFISDCKLLLFGDPAIPSQRGRIIATGTHQELCSSSPLYSKLVADAQLTTSQAGDPLEADDAGQETGGSEGPASPYHADSEDPALQSRMARVGPQAAPPSDRETPATPSS